MEIGSYVPDEPYVPAIDPNEIKQTHQELLALRSEHGKFTTAKLSQYPTLVRLCGEDDLIEAFLALKRELQRYKHGNKHQAAAALSIISPADTVLERFTLTAEHFDYQDQRTIRRWSDKGLKGIAEDLVAIANVRGRLGRELLTLTLTGNPKDGFQLVIDQMDFTQLASTPPGVTMWLWVDEDNAEEANIELTEETSRSANNQTYRNTRWQIELPDVSKLLADQNRRTKTDKILTIAIQGRNAPSRTVVWSDHSTLPKEIISEVTIHRTMVMVEMNYDN